MPPPRTGELALPARLAGMRLLADLSGSALERLAAGASVHRYAPGTSILSREDAGCDVCFVLAGTVRVVIFAPNGRAVLFRDLGTGETIGEIAALDGHPRSATVEALTEAELVRLPGAAFRDLVAREARVANALLSQTVRYIRELTERVYELSSLNVADRVQAELLRLVRQAGGGTHGEVIVSPAPRHADIADRIGAQREAVTRELSRLSRMGLVERRGRTLVIRDIAQLARLVAGLNRD